MHVIHIIVYFFDKLNPTCHGMGPSLLFHIIECLVVLLTCSLTKKYDPNGMLRTPKHSVVGYNTTNKGYRLWQPSTKMVKECVDVMFNETSTSLVTPSTTFPISYSFQNDSLFSIQLVNTTSGNTTR